MTDFEQQAREMARAIIIPDATMRYMSQDDATRYIASALADADRKAREECADIADCCPSTIKEGGVYTTLSGRYVAAAIRATIPAQGGPDHA